MSTDHGDGRLKVGRGTAATVLLVIAAGSMSGCFSRAKKERLDAEHDNVRVEGRVEWSAPVTGPVLLFVSAVGEPETIYGYRVIEEPREFEFALPRGRSYSLWAVEDADRDYRCEPGDRGSESLIHDAVDDVQGVVVGIEADSRTHLTETYDARESPPVDLLVMARSFANTGTVVELTDERFSTEWADKGITAPVTVLLEVGAGTYMLQEFDRKRIPVLFVHGAGGTPRDFTYLIEHLDDRLQPWIYHYPSGFQLREIAEHLNDTIEELHVRHRFEEMYVVAHSMGGLVSRSFIQQNASNGHAYVTRFLTISTPWHGHSGATMGVRFAPDSVPSWHDMVPGSEFQVEILETPIPESLKFQLFFSYKGSSMLTEGADDGSVSLHSQLAHSVQQEADTVYGFNETHTTVLSNDEVVARLAEFLR